METDEPSCAVVCRDISGDFRGDPVNFRDIPVRSGLIRTLPTLPVSLRLLLRKSPLIRTHYTSHTCYWSNSGQHPITTHGDTQETRCLQSCFPAFLLVISEEIKRPRAIWSCLLSRSRLAMARTEKQRKESSLSLFSLPSLHSSLHSFHQSSTSLLLSIHSDYLIFSFDAC